MGRAWRRLDEKKKTVLSREARRTSGQLLIAWKKGVYCRSHMVEGCNWGELFV